MATMDPEDRIDVHEAIAHPYFKEFYPNLPPEQACPFKVGVSFWNCNGKFFSDLLSWVEIENAGFQSLSSLEYYGIF